MARLRSALVIMDGWQPGAEAHQRIATWRSQWRPQCADSDLARQGEKVFACSEFIYTRSQQYPELLQGLIDTGLLQRPAAPGESPARIRDALLGLEQADEAVQLAQLRRIRHTELIRIGWRELTGCATVEETLAELSVLAETLIDVASLWAHTQVRTRHGQINDQQGQPEQLGVIAMGKLGGAELNFSSDVDLVFLYRLERDSDGQRPLSAGEYFTRVAQQLIRLLQTPTGDGFVYRVDARLRPFGSAGALALSRDALELYLQQHGRDWERYAYIKARMVSGPVRLGENFAAMVRPFAYRRYLDYGVFESLREMQALIAADVKRIDREADIKLGPGGIREIEFIVQALQLLRGGADPQLREPSLLKVLPRLERRGWLEPVQARQLAGSYRLLRRVENCLQIWRDEQTHSLPADSQARERLAYATGAPNWAQLQASINSARAAVSACFESATGGPDEQHSDPLEATWKADPRLLSGTGEFVALGYRQPSEVQQQLQNLHHGSQYRRLDQRGRDRLDILVPRILRLAARFDKPDELLHRLLNIVQAVGGRSAYFALLIENPPVLQRLAEVTVASSWVARRIAESPILLDELIDPQMFTVPPRRTDFAHDLQQRFAAVDSDDLELQMDALRLFKQASVFRVAVADLAGVLPLMKVSDRLTDIAELVLDKVVLLSRQRMRHRYGRPMEGGREAGFAVIGYGKLGGLELSYSSDLDLVFVHDAIDAGGLSDGQNPIDNQRFFTRLGQRILHMLSTTTASGVLYEADMRLRPSGKAGPMVSSLESLHRYQLHSAWTWEHQALLRARAVAGDPEVCQQFEALRAAVLTRPRDEQQLRGEVRDMRQRMRRELSSRSAGQFDLKQGRGGLTDIEFMVQFQVLAAAAQQPSLVRYSDNIRQLEGLAGSARMDAGHAAELARIYRRYRQRLHQLALADQPGKVASGEFVAERDFVRQRWRELFQE